MVDFAWLVFGKRSKERMRRWDCLYGNGVAAPSPILAFAQASMGGFGRWPAEWWEWNRRHLFPLFPSVRIGYC